MSEPTKAMVEAARELHRIGLIWRDEAHHNQAAALTMRALSRLQGDNFSPISEIVDGACLVMSVFCSLGPMKFSDHIICMEAQIAREKLERGGQS